MYSIRAKLALASLLLSWTAGVAFGSDYIDVLVGVAPNASNSVSATEEAAKLFAELPIVMADSDLIGLNFRFIPYPTSANYPNENLGNATDAHDWLVDQKDVFFELSRNVGIGPIQGFDLLVMIVEKMDPVDPGPNGPVTCGATFTNLSITDPSGNMIFDNSDSERFAYIVLSDVDRCQGHRTSTFSHEFGHVIGAEHQLDVDPNDSQPVNYNHPYSFFDITNGVQARTLLWGTWTSATQLQFSRVGSVFKNFPTFPAGDSDSDVARLVDERWDHVAAYRPLAAGPEPCYISLLPVCLPQATQASFSISPIAPPGSTVIDMTIDELINTSIWQLIDVHNGPGSFTCTGYQPAVLTWLRVLITTSVGLSQCYIQANPFLLNQMHCDGGSSGSL